MPKKSIPVPTVEFVCSVDSSAGGTRVRWQSKRDNHHHPQSFELVAASDGVRFCGYSPTLDEVASETMARILGLAWCCVEMIREGVAPHALEKIIEQSEVAWSNICELSKEG